MNRPAYTMAEIKSSKHWRHVDRFDGFNRFGGIIPLQPTFVHRFYPDLNRLGQDALGLRTRRAPFVPERWIASSVQAMNARPLPGGGLSFVGGMAGLQLPPLSLRNLIRARPVEMLGEKLFRAHGPEFRVLVKILDPGQPIAFHLHANDAQVERRPANFVGHRFGKDEAYYFLDAPKGPQPYTHAGLHAGVTIRDLMQAIARGPERALELSPSFYQATGRGFFVPAGVPHRPGTALTLEIQQPSDVYTLMETSTPTKRLSARQIHPGFKSMEAAMSLIDLKLSNRVALTKGFELIPRAKTFRGGSIESIFPANVCRKFSGDRLVVDSTLQYSRQSPLAVLIWRGHGRINGKPVRAGEEFFIAFDVARRGIVIESRSAAPLELFALMPVP